jgi:hypothetical protein
MLSRMTKLASSFLPIQSLFVQTGWVLTSPENIRLGWKYTLVSLGTVCV